MAFHTYTCYGRYLKDHIEKYKVFQSFGLRGDTGRAGLESLRPSLKGL